MGMKEYDPNSGWRKSEALQEEIAGKPSK
jgi:hypothetical protein